MWYLICGIITFLLACTALFVLLLIDDDAEQLPLVVIASILIAIFWPITVATAFCAGLGYLVYRKWFKK